MIRIFFLLPVLFSLLALQNAKAQDTNPPQPGTPDTNKVQAPPPVQKKPYDKAQNIGELLGSDRMLLGKSRLTGNTHWLFGRTVVDDCPEPRVEFRSAVALYTRLAIVEPYSLNVTFYKNFNERSIQRWTPDFTYSFGKLTFAPFQFNYGYENYVNNKYTDTWEQLKDKYLLGFYFITYGHNLSEKTMKNIKADSTSNIRFNYFIRYSLGYQDRFDNVHFAWDKGKPVLGASFRYTMVKNIYFEYAVMYYPRKDIPRLPWDPDYTYGFGYFDWRPFRFTITYGNWVINRFPWNIDEHTPQHSFRDGDFKVSLNFSW